MKKVLVGTLIGLFAVSVASAQQPQDKFMLTVTVQQLNAIGRALPYLPKFEADPLIADLSKQVQEQQEKAREEVSKKADEKK